jgi:hypothetical protein
VNLVPLRWCELERRATHLVTGPVHEHVEACIAVDDLADELRRGVPPTEVPGQCPGLAPSLRYACFGLLELTFGSTRQHDAGAGAREGLGHGPPEPSSSARDEGHLGRQVPRRLQVVCRASFRRPPASQCDPRLSDRTTG